MGFNSAFKVLIIVSRKCNNISQFVSLIEVIKFYQFSVIVLAELSRFRKFSFVGFRMCSLLHYTSIRAVSHTDSVLTWLNN